MSFKKNLNSHVLTIYILLILIMVGQLSDIFYYKCVLNKLDKLQEAFNELIQPPLPNWEP